MYIYIYIPIDGIVDETLKAFGSFQVMKSIETGGGWSESSRGHGGGVKATDVSGVEIGIGDNFRAVFAEDNPHRHFFVFADDGKGAPPLLFQLHPTIFMFFYSVFIVGIMVGINSFIPKSLVNIKFIQLNEYNKHTT